MPRGRIELSTHGFSVRCSTNWATSASMTKNLVFFSFTPSICALTGIYRNRLRVKDTKNQAEFNIPSSSCQLNILAVNLLCSREGAEILYSRPWNGSGASPRRVGQEWQRYHFFFVVRWPCQYSRVAEVLDLCGPSPKGSATWFLILRSIKFNPEQASNPQEFCLLPLIISSL